MTVLVIICTIFLSFSLASGSENPELKKKPIEIDFNEIIPDKSLQLPSSHLRIAVAAMISPKYTYK